MCCIFCQTYFIHKLIHFISRMLQLLLAIDSSHLTDYLLKQLKSARFRILLMDTCRPYALWSADGHRQITAAQPVRIMSCISLDNSKTYLQITNNCKLAIADKYIHYCYVRSAQSCQHLSRICDLFQRNVVNILGVDYKKSC